MFFTSQSTDHLQTPFEWAGMAVGRQMKLAELAVCTMAGAPFEQLRLMQKVGALQLQLMSPALRQDVLADSAATLKTETGPGAAAKAPARPAARRAAAKPSAAKTPAAKKTVVREAPAAKKPVEPAAPLRSRRAGPAMPSGKPEAGTTFKATESAKPIRAEKPANMTAPTGGATKPVAATKPGNPGKKT